jgi:hypothetical protein
LDITLLRMAEYRTSLPWHWLGKPPARNMTIATVALVERANVSYLSR